MPMISFRDHVTNEEILETIKVDEVITTTAKNLGSKRRVSGLQRLWVDYIKEKVGRWIHLIQDRGC